MATPCTSDVIQHSSQKNNRKPLNGVFSFNEYLYYMKKVIRLTESDLVRIIKNVLNEQSGPNNFFGYQESVDTQMKKVKPDVGGKYCFTNQTLNYEKKINDRYTLIYKIKKGDVLSKFDQDNGGFANDIDWIKQHNNLCPEIKNNVIKVGDVIIVATNPKN